jgi:HK97 family phage prohead protease
LLAGELMAFSCFKTAVGLRLEAFLPFDVASTGSRDSRVADGGGPSVLFRAGAFDAAIAGGGVVALLNHDADSRIASQADGSLVLSADHRGLWIFAQVRDWPLDRQLREYAYFRQLNGVSVGFDLAQAVSRRGAFGVEVYDRAPISEVSFVVGSSRPGIRESWARIAA